MKDNNQKGFVSLNIIALLIAVFLTIFLLVFYKKNSELFPNLLSDQSQSDSKYKIAYRGGGTFIDPGDLWIMNPDGTNKTQKTKTGNIDKIFGWSPDNSKIAVRAIDPSTSNGSYSLSVVDISKGTVSIINKEDCVTADYKWISNNSILKIQGSCSNESLSFAEKISLLDNSSEKLLLFPDDLSDISRSFDLGSSTLFFSKDLKWMAYDKKPCCEGPTFPSEIFVFNLQTKTKKQLTQTGENKLQGWNKNKILFTHKDSEVWEINPDGTNLKKVFEDKDLVEHQVPDTNEISIIKISDNKILYSKYVGWVQNYLYDYMTGKKEMLIKQEFNDPPQFISLSSNNQFVSYAQRFGHDETKDSIVCWTKFLSNNKLLKTTEDKCFYPSISN